MMMVMMVTMMMVTVVAMKVMEVWWGYLLVEIEMKTNSGGVNDECNGCEDDGGNDD